MSFERVNAPDRSEGHADAELHSRVIPKLQKLLGTENRVFLFSSSSVGVWEAAIRNCVKRKVLCCTQGAFSERWLDVAMANGKDADSIQVEWGRAVTGEMIDRTLGEGGYDAITVMHNETSTGVMNHLDEIAGVMRNYPDVAFLVDAVSSMAGSRINVDGYGIDVCLAGFENAFSLPGGLALASISDKAFAKAKTIDYRGYYFDFLEMLKYDGRSMAPTNLVNPQIEALDTQLDVMLAEGLERRYERHAELARLTREWAGERFELFSQEGFESPTVTCVTNTRRISVTDLNTELGKHSARISNGYGRLKDKTFRIGHTGDTQERELRGLLATIDRILGL